MEFRLYDAASVLVRIVYAYFYVIFALVRPFDLLTLRRLTRAI